MDNRKKKHLERFEEFQLADGGCLEPPEEDSGAIRRRDIHGNTQHVTEIGDPEWDHYASLWNLTKADFEEVEVEAVEIKTPNDTLQIVYQALRQANLDTINDVTMEKGVDNQDQVILTTDDGENKKIWVIDAESILECDNSDLPD